MIFAPLPIAEAEGAILAHTTRLPDGTLFKGSVLTAAALARLAAAGQVRVLAARPEPGDVAENEAAARLAAALTVPGMTPTRAATGRANLAATHAGLFRVTESALHAINALHEGLTVATLPDATPVGAGDLLATVKIIPFAIPGAMLAAAEHAASAHAPLRLPSFRPLRVGLVLTQLPGLKSSVLRGAVAATRKRIEAMTGTLLPPQHAPHAVDAVAGSLRALLAQGAELLLVAGASATVDRFDICPSAVRGAGGVIDHFGMPVDPGNLLCLGHIGDVAVLVLPGCARSPALNGIDLMLRRIFAGEPAGAAEIAGMGAGGLLKEFSPRPAPRSRDESHSSRSAESPLPLDGERVG